MVLLSQTNQSEKLVMSIEHRIVRGGNWAKIDVIVDHTLFIAPFDKIPSLGRFVLRDAGATIAIGTIVELKKQFSKNWTVC